MTPEQLKFSEEFPKLYLELVEKGKQLERIRVLAHLDTAQFYDSLYEATQAIREGMSALPIESLHDFYADIEDERDRKFGLRSG